MTSRKLFYARIVGTGINATLKVTSHELRGLPAGTYHVFTLENGAVLYFNDFGVRTVTIADTLDQLS